MDCCFIQEKDEDGICICQVTPLSLPALDFEFNPLERCVTLANKGIQLEPEA